MIYIDIYIYIDKYIYTYVYIYEYIYIYIYIYILIPIIFNHLSYKLTHFSPHVPSYSLKSKTQVVFWFLLEYAKNVKRERCLKLFSILFFYLHDFCYLLNFQSVRLVFSMSENNKRYCEISR